jgi:outer membrane protein OmpA-like peptidoglycan-associated protein
MFSRYWLNPHGLLNIETGLGGGLLIWKVTDAETDAPVRVTADRAPATDFAASELILSAAVGLIVQPTAQLSFGLKGYGDYLTGAGTSFAPPVDDLRNRFLLGAAATINFHFGATEKPTAWRSDESWAAQPATRPATWLSRADADADGVADPDDKCFNTPRGVIVDRNGCPVDSDSDGVPDGLDDCPGTPALAAGQVDIFGCPVDSDFDGIPDYRDTCPHNPVGADIDDAGCPVDSDSDGVPDGLDDCPFTLVGVDVDKYGCIDLSTFAQPMVLNIDYIPGSFEVDPNNLERLKRLAGVLRFVTDLKLEVNGYTDNIGTTQANAELSLKRARRVRDYLVTYGVDTNRITANGRGETDFIDSNQTAEGRARNRRIEIVFYK